MKTSLRARRPRPTLRTKRSGIRAAARAGGILVLLAVLLLAGPGWLATARAAEVTPTFVAAAVPAAPDDTAADDAEGATEPSADDAAGEDGEDEDGAGEPGSATRPRVAPSTGNPVERTLQPPDSRARPGRPAGLPGAR